MRLPMPRPGRLDGLLALAAALAGLGALALVTPDPGERGADALAVALVLIGAAGLLLRRAPLAALAVTASVAVAAAAIGYPPWGFLPAPLAALFLVALEGGRTRLVAVATAAAAAAVLATALFGHEATLAAPETAAHVALVLLPLAAGEALRQRRGHVAELVRRAEEQERLRIARDLHDVAAHTITAISVQAGVAAHLVARDPARAEGALTAIAHASREALDELRAVLGGAARPRRRRAPRCARRRRSPASTSWCATRRRGRPGRARSSGGRPGRAAAAGRAWPPTASCRRRSPTCAATPARRGRRVAHVRGRRAADARSERRRRDGRRRRPAAAARAARACASGRRPSGGDLDGPAPTGDGFAVRPSCRCARRG